MLLLFIFISVHIIKMMNINLRLKEYLYIFILSSRIIIQTSHKNLYKKAMLANSNPNPITQQIKQQITDSSFK